MRSLLNGEIKFGLVNMPVALSPATRAGDVSFRRLHRECLVPLQRGGTWCPIHERDVDEGEVVRGWEVARGQFVLVDEADLEAIELGVAAGAIEVERFVPLAEVGPEYVDRTYWLDPPVRSGSAVRPYVILLRAMQKTGYGALARLVRAGRDRPCLIRPLGDALALQTLLLAEDVLSPASIEEAVASVRLGESELGELELGLAEEIIASLATPFELAELRSEYRTALRELLEAKLTEGLTEAVEPPSEGVVDLLEALRASVAAVRDKPTPAARRPRNVGKRSRAKGGV